jgi:O-antigen biosynthesis protein WbqP
MALGRVFCRAIDFSVAIFLFIPAFFMCLMAAIIIWIECRANPLFVQTRIGLHCQPFKLFKLRTMRPDTIDAASHHVSQNQILRCGRSLRATKLDELPQILNILNGTMSVVGPRPCLPSQTELIAERQRRGVMDILPGITGISQVAGIDMSDPVKLAISDAEYLERRSIGLYLHCLVATFTGKGSGDAVKNA